MVRRAFLTFIAILIVLGLPGLSAFPGRPPQSGEKPTASKPAPEAVINVAAEDAAGLLAAKNAANASGEADTNVQGGGGRLNRDGTVAVAGSAASDCAPHVYADPAGACGGNTPCYSSLSLCYSNVCEGGTISVSGGTYDESFTLDRNLTVELSGDVDLTGPFIQSAGALEATPGIWTVRGDFLLNGGSFDANGGTVFLGGSGSQTIGGAGTVALDNVTVGDRCWGYWKLDEGTGATAADSSGNGQTGTLYGSPAWVTSGLPPATFHDPAALSFDGTDDYVQGSASALPAGHSAMTVLAWIKTAATGRQTIFSFGPASDGTAVALDIDQLGGSGGHFWVDFYNDSVDSGVAVCDGKWHQVGFTIAGGTTAITMYVDGKPYPATLSTVPDIGAGSTFQIGRYVGPSPFLFNGVVDDVRICGRALSAADLLNLYNGGMEARWKFDEGSGATSFADATGHGHTGACSGSSCPTSGVPGAFGPAVSFDGSDDEIDAPVGAGFDFGAGQDFSVSLWVKTGGGAPYASLVSNKFSYGSYEVAGWIVSMNSDGTNWRADAWDGSSRFLAISSGRVDDGKWHHLVATFDRDGYLNLYQDGVAAGSLSISSMGSVTTGQPISLGRLPDGGYPYGGAMDDVRIYKRALTAAEVKTIYYGQYVGYWKFDEGSGATAADSSGNGKTATLSGSLAWSSTVAPTAFANPFSLSFDGGDGAVTIMDSSQKPAYTLAVWVRPADTSNRSIVLRTNPSGPNTTWSEQLRIRGGVFQHYLFDNDSRYVIGTTPVQAGTWYHVAAVATVGGSMLLYVNGRPEGTPFPIGALQTSMSRYLAGPASSGIGNFSGLMDDLRIYDCALSAAEVALLAAGGAPSATARTVTLGSPLSASGSIHLQDATLDVGPGSQPVSVGGGWIVDGGSFAPGTGTVTFGGSGVQSLSGDTGFRDLAVGPSSVLTTASTVAVTGTLTNGGWTDETKSVAGAGKRAWVLAGITTDVATPGSLSSLRVKRRDQNHPDAPPGLQTGKYWNITPTGSGYSVNLTLPHPGLPAPEACRYSLGSWDCGRTSFTAGTVTRDGVTAFSDWAVGGAVPPPVGDGRNSTTAARFSKDAVTPGQIDVTYDASSCLGERAIILYGSLGSFTVYGGIAQCEGGNAGTATIDSSIPSNVWFNVIWTNGTTAGNPGYGFDGTSQVQRTWPASARCSITADDRSRATCP